MIKMRGINEYCEVRLTTDLEPKSHGSSLNLLLWAILKIMSTVLSKTVLSISGHILQTQRMNEPKKKKKKRKKKTNDTSLTYYNNMFEIHSFGKSKSSLILERTL